VHKHDVLDDWCRRVGRDPAEIERSAGVGHGDPAEVGPAILGAGTRLLTVGVGGPAFDLGRLADWVAWRDEVQRS
jgi:hypothetical protein